VRASASAHVFIVTFRDHAAYSRIKTATRFLAGRRGYWCSSELRADGRRVHRSLHPRSTPRAGAAGGTLRACSLAFISMRACAADVLDAIIGFVLFRDHPGQLVRRLKYNGVPAGRSRSARIRSRDLGRVVAGLWGGRPRYLEASRRELRLLVCRSRGRHLFHGSSTGVILAPRSVRRSMTWSRAGQRRERGVRGRQLARPRAC